MITVLIVAFHPRLEELGATVDSLVEAHAAGLPFSLSVWHNDDGPARTSGLTDLYARARQAGLQVTLSGGKGNLGFGRAINAALHGIETPYVLVLNQDAIPEPGALNLLWQTAQDDDDAVAAWEMRQIPYEHPKDYDPVTGDTGWCSGAAVLLRTQALRQVHGFEPRFFMYCEDVDLSWRLRCAGWRLRYIPRCAVVHNTYAEPGEIKPLASLQGFYANLCLRARYSARRHVLDGIRQLTHELRVPQPFAGRRTGILKALLKFASQYRYFRRTRKSKPGFQPCFRGWDYEQRREGSFHPFRAQADPEKAQSAVAVVVRARGTADDLHQWLSGLANQTLQPMQVLVVHDDDATARDMIRYADALEISDVRAGDSESLADIARRHTSAEWLLLADDVQHRLYADHIEVLMQAAIDHARPAACGQLWHIHAPAVAARDAHRLHTERHVSTSPPAAHPSPLVHRSALSAAWTSNLLQVPKLTAVRYAVDRA